MHNETKTADSGMNKTGKQNKLLNGSLLFLALVVYFNLRSPEPTTLIDWIVIGIGAAFTVFSLIKKFSGKDE